MIESNASASNNRSRPCLTAADASSSVERMQPVPFSPLTDSICSVMGLLIQPRDMSIQPLECGSLWHPGLARGSRLPCLPVFHSYHLTVHATALRVWPEQTSSTCAAAAVAAAWNTLCISTNSRSSHFQTLPAMEQREVHSACGGEPIHGTSTLPGQTCVVGSDPCGTRGV